jgi:hypothetical protein
VLPVADFDNLKVVAIILNVGESET